MSRSPRTLWQVFRAPLLLAVLSMIGLVAALIGDGLLDLLSESHFAAVCCQWTPETDKLMSKEAFAAMKPDGVMTNVARGEIVVVDDRLGVTMTEIIKSDR